MSTITLLICSQTPNKMNQKAHQHLMPCLPTFKCIISSDLKSFNHYSLFFLTVILFNFLSFLVNNFIKSFSIQLFKEMNTFIHLISCNFYLFVLYWPRQGAQTKMSASDANTSIFLTDTPKQIKVLYVQEVVTLQKKTFNIFASENEVYTIFLTITILQVEYYSFTEQKILGHMNLIG